VDRISAQPEGGRDRKQSGLAPETLLPSQFGDLLRNAAARSPEHHLMCAVLEDAIRIYVGMLNRSDRRGRRLFREIAEWFASDDATWPFSFIVICQQLDFEPDYLRLGLHHRRQSTRQPGRTP
jgi:hypothetical protein